MEEPIIEESTETNQLSLDEIEESAIENIDETDEIKEVIAEAEEEETDEEDEEDEEEEKLEVPPVDKKILESGSEESYIYDNLEEITVKGQDEDGNVIEHTIKIASDLPDNFQPNTYKDQQLLNEKLATQRLLADKLSKEYQTNQQNADIEAEREIVQASWENELSEMHKSGELPEIKVKEGDKDYWEDEGVKAVAEIVDYMTKENDRLAKAESPYRLQSLQQAKRLFDVEKSKEEDKAQDSREAQIRKQKGSMVSSSGSNSGQRNSPNPYYAAGDDLETVATKAIDDIMAGA